MLASNTQYSKMFGNQTDCQRTIGGNCVGNCRKSATTTDCQRTIGGNCVGNCRKSAKATSLKW